MLSPLTLAEYIEKFQDWYVIDDTNRRLVELLGYYAVGDSKFESAKDDAFIFKDQKKLYLEKGLLLLGNTGIGKTALLRILKFYYSYLIAMNNPNQFRIASIPAITQDFNINGRVAFASFAKGNWMMDELCFINEATGKPDQEIGISYGDRVLVGEKIIYSRYDIFLEHGFKTHFTTNASLKQLKEIYGERVFYRLIEMNNVLVYIGDNRRPNKRPHFYKSAAVIQNPHVDTSTELLNEFDSKKDLQELYESYCIKPNLNLIYEKEYDELVAVGEQVDALDAYIEIVKKDFRDVEEYVAIRYAKKMAVAAYFDAAIVQKKSQLFVK